MDDQYQITINQGSNECIPLLISTPWVPGSDGTRTIFSIDKHGDYRVPEDLTIEEARTVIDNLVQDMKKRGWPWPGE